MAKDEPILHGDEQEILQDALQKLGIENELICFSDGALALAYIKATEAEPLLILSDVNMPVMNGIELCKRINNDEEARCKSIPFIFISTDTGTLTIKEAYRAFSKAAGV